MWMCYVWIVMSQYMLLGGRHLYVYVPFSLHAPFSCSATWQESRPLSSITSSDGSTTSVYSVYCLPHTTTSHCLHQPDSSRDDHTPWTSPGSTHRYVTCNWVSVVLFSGPAHLPIAVCEQVMGSWTGPAWEWGYCKAVLVNPTVHFGYLVLRTWR